MELLRTDAFERQLRKLFKKYPNSQHHTEQQLNKLQRTPRRGDKFPGFGGMQVRKWRIAVPTYRMGKSNGFRLVFVVGPRKVLPLLIYKKGDLSEQEIIKSARQALKDVLQELNT